MSLGRGLSIRSLLLGAHAFVLLLPLLAVSALRIYDVALLRQTEHQLIAESVMVGEMFRAAYLAAEGGADDAYRPPDHGSGEYTPVAAQIDFGSAVGPREPTAFPRATAHPASVEAAGLAIAAQLRRAQTFNLSALRVLDAAGCVVASTRGQLGLCLDSLPEVAAALRGRYAAVLRERVSDEPPPRFGDIRRRGKVRVFTALPVFSNGRVVAVVRASRTGLDALSSLWGHRRSLLGAGLAIGLLVLGISLASAAAISRPLFRLTRAAESVARGGDVRALDVPGREPREVAQLRAVLGAMATRLDARARYVNDFASEVSHELKTPITAIRGAAELLQHGLDDMPADDRARFLANIVEDAARMERLVTRLLNLARVENAPPERAPALDPELAARRLCARYGPRVAVTAAPGLAPLHIDPEQLESVLVNLVDNALRHGAGEPVRITLAPRGARLLLSVHDRGPGVSEANQKRLFTRFFTTERDRGGTGLGLALVKAVAEARHGSVWAEFNTDGSTFRVEL